MGNFLLGCMVGMVTGVITVSLCVVSKQADNEMENNIYKNDENDKTEG